MATISAWAVGSFVAVTRFAPVAMTVPSFATSAANGPPPFRMFARANAMAWRMKSDDMEIAFYLQRQLCQRFRKHESPFFNVFGRRILIRPMTVSLKTRNKKHSGWRNPRNKKRVVISAANHGETA